MPKLPADLPENWTQGQTISPNGTEVGLTEKHGYNYLMKQVNDTQTEVNNINTALTDVAQQATVDEIKNKIGTESDADTQPTLFGRLAQLKNVLVEKLAELLEKVSGFDTKIGETDDTVGSNKAGSVMGKLNTIYNLLMGGLVVYDEPGTYEWTVPAGITKIKVSGCGAGAGAGGAIVRDKTVASERLTVIGGSGGGAGACIVEKEYTVTPGTKMTIKVGKKGVGGKGKNAGTSLGTKGNDGTDGESTIIGELITLPGGHKGVGGVSANIREAVETVGGASGGTGATKGANGFLYFRYDGWNHKNNANGNGGTTDLKNTGNGGSCTWKWSDSGNPADSVIDGTDGLDGYVSISWGV